MELNKGGGNAATAAMLRKRWLQVMNHMMEIAVGEKGGERSAVQAARFLDGVRQGLEGQHEGHKVEGKSVAAALLERFKEGPSTVNAKRTVITEEIDLTTG